MFKYIYIIVIGGLLLTSCGKPLAKFSLDQSQKSVPSTIKFDNQSDKGTTYLWDFGDGNTSTEENPAHKYYLSGKYKVKLKVTKGKKTNNTTQVIFFDAPDLCLVEMETSKGTMLIHLYDDTPLHRDNFIKLSETGFFEDLLFHRVIKGFMVQAGDPNSKNARKGARLGSGGPGYTIEAEFNPKHIHKKGALSAARQGDGVNPEKRSSGSQFYIVDGKKPSEKQLDQIAAQNGTHYTKEQKEIYSTLGGTPFLDNNYTVFGEVIEGLKVIDLIANEKTAKGDRPHQDIKIIKLTIIK